MSLRGWVYEYMGVCEVDNASLSVWNEKAREGRARDDSTGNESGHGSQVARQHPRCGMGHSTVKAVKGKKNDPAHGGGPAYSKLRGTHQHASGLAQMLWKAAVSWIEVVKEVVSDACRVASSLQKTNEEGIVIWKEVLEEGEAACVNYPKETVAKNLTIQLKSSGAHAAAGQLDENPSRPTCSSSVARVPWRSRRENRGHDDRQERRLDAPNRTMVDLTGEASASSDQGAPPLDDGARTWAELVGLLDRMNESADSSSCLRKLGGKTERDE